MVFATRVFVRKYH